MGKLKSFIVSISMELFQIDSGGQSTTSSADNYCVNVFPRNKA